MSTVCVTKDIKLTKSPRPAGGQKKPCRDLWSTYTTAPCDEWNSRPPWTGNKELIIFLWEERNVLPTVSAPPPPPRPGGAGGGAPPPLSAFCMCQSWHHTNQVSHLLSPPPPFPPSPFLTSYNLFLPPFLSLCTLPPPKPFSSPSHPSLILFSLFPFFSFLCGLFCLFKKKTEWSFFAPF
jgi:hypothetical protein